jgi:predicted nucleotidyltransferase
MNKALLNKKIIYSELQKHKKVLEQYGVERIGLFGSFGRDEETEKSDIDFLVDFNKGEKTLSNLVDLGLFLEKLFQKKVDIVTAQGLSPFIGPYILKEVRYA